MAHRPFGTDLPQGRGRARPLCPCSSDFDLFGDRQGVVDLDPYISDRALDLGVTKQKLNGARVSLSTVDQRGLCSAERMCPEQPRIQANAAYPTRNEAGILPGRGAMVRLAAAFEQILAQVPLFELQIGIHCFQRLLRQLELYRMPGLLLTDARLVGGQALRGDILDFEMDDVALTQLAIDRQI